MNAVRRCDACRWSEVLVPSGHRVCTEATVNVPTPAFLAGNHAVARSCLLERGCRRGPCGPMGHRWAARPDDQVLGLPPESARLDV
jgi:hypothetical protein